MRLSTSTAQKIFEVIGLVFKDIEAIEAEFNPLTPTSVGTTDATAPAEPNLDDQSVTH